MSEHDTSDEQVGINMAVAVGLMVSFMIVVGVLVNVFA